MRRLNKYAGLVVVGMNEWIWFKWRWYRNCCTGTVQKQSYKMAFSVSVEMMQQWWVFRCKQKEASDDADQTLGGKERNIGGNGQL